MESVDEVKKNGLGHIDRLNEDAAVEAFFLVFAFKICLRQQSVTPILSGAPPPKKNPGSIPVFHVRVECEI